VTVGERAKGPPFDRSLRNLATPFVRSEWEDIDLGVLERDGKHLEQFFRWAEEEARVELALLAGPGFLTLLDVTSRWNELLTVADAVIGYARLRGDARSAMIASAYQLEVFCQQQQFDEALVVLDQGEAWIVTDAQRQEWLLYRAAYHRFRREFQQAERYAEAALAVIEASTDQNKPQWLASATFEIGKLHRDQGQYELAKVSFLQAGEAFSEDDALLLLDGGRVSQRFNVERAWGLLGNLGLIELRIGRAADAIPILERALKHFQEHGRPGNVTSFQIRLAEALALDGRTAESRVLLEAAIAKAESLGLLRDLEDAAIVEALLDAGPTAE
jgi:tetratricopeptide (TPR) repeat protein